MPDRILCALCGLPVDTLRIGAVQYRDVVMHESCLSHAAHTARHLNESSAPGAVTEWDRHHDQDEYARDLRREYDDE